MIRTFCLKKTWAHVWNYWNAGPGLSERNKHKIIYHPSTGLCIQRKPVMGVQLGNCLESNHWTYTPEKSLTIKGSYFCLQAQGLNSPARLSIQCAGMGTSWTPISDSKLHLSATLRKSSNVCLDVDSNNNVITSKCKCLSKDSNSSVWFYYLYFRLNFPNQQKIFWSIDY